MMRLMRLMLGDVRHIKGGGLPGVGHVAVCCQPATHGCWMCPCRPGLPWLLCLCCCPQKVYLLHPGQQPGWLHAWVPCWACPCWAVHAQGSWMCPCCPRLPCVPCLCESSCIHAGQSIIAAGADRYLNEVDENAQKERCARIRPLCGAVGAMSGARSGQRAT